MEKFIIEGGVPLKGKITTSGAKNAAIKMIVASLLTDDEVVLENVPQIDDVEVDLEIVRSLGVEARYTNPGVLKLFARKIHSYEVFRELSCRSRAAILLVGPLLARFGRAKIFELGGCQIGARPINRHIEALSKLGAEFRYEDGCYEATSPRGLRGAGLTFEKNTVMGTENAILSSILALGETNIVGAAQEPEVDDLILLLTKMGAKIRRIAGEGRKSEILIEGVKALSGAAHRVIPDRNEAVTFAIAAAVTRGNVTVCDVRPKDLTSFLAKLSAAKVSYEVGEDTLLVWADRGAVLNPVDITTSTHPGFMTDWQQPFCVLLTQASGESTIHETVYSNRFEYTKELNRMGASISLFHPQMEPSIYGFDDYKKDGLYAAKVSGPTPLVGKRLTVTDLRAGATLVLAALTARGKSEVLGAEVIDRGYERLDEKLSILGAKIQRVI